MVALPLTGKLGARGHLQRTIIRDWKGGRSGICSSPRLYRSAEALMLTAAELIDDHQMCQAQEKSPGFVY